MAKKTKKINVKQDVHFVGYKNSPLASEVQLHKSAVTLKLDEMKKDYDDILTQVTVIISDSDSPVEKSGFKLDEIKVSLGFDAKGKIGFILAGAEASVNAGIEITFKKV